VQWVVKIRLATQTYPGYPGYAVLATEARDECVSTLGIALYESKDRYHHHQPNDITHPNESFEASPFLSSKNTFKDSIHYLVVIAIGHAPGKVSVRVLLLPCGQTRLQVREVRLHKPCTRMFPERLLEVQC
jgi:hypothetical protein